MVITLVLDSRSMSSKSYVIEKATIAQYGILNTLITLENY